MRLLYLLILAVLTTFCPLAAATNSITLPDLSTLGQTGGWAIADSASVRLLSDAASSYIETTLPAGAAKAEATATYDIPLESIRGAVVLVSVEARAVNVQQPEKAYLGIKLMLHTSSPTAGDSYPQADGNGKTFPVNYDWKRLSFRAMAPKDAVMARLVLGIQDTSGTVDFHSPQVRVVARAVEAPDKTPAGPIYTGHGQGALRGTMAATGIKADDIPVLGSWGANVVRYQIAFPKSTATESQGDFDAAVDGVLDHLDQIIPVFNQYGIKVALVQMGTPGGRDSANTCEKLFSDPAWQSYFISRWEKTARRYKGNKTIWAYDLLNEPVLGDIAPGLLDWHDLAERTARAIRSIDKEHAIVVEPDPWADPSALSYFSPIDVPGVVYSVHMYSPHEFTHQGVYSNPVGAVYPGVIAGRTWDKNTVRATLQPAIDYGKMFHVQIYVGEFSAARWAKGADRYLADVIDVCEDNHWDWSYHAFREWQGWSPELGEDKSVTTPAASPTARLLVLQKAFSKNQQFSSIKGYK
ncbi:MAG: cellulase family glycosylhydrolase [Capsulimonadaceae bacterium]|nr:cellulase family glycosylhydrolase [Capsulimonadaceae bacterium]